VVEVEMAAPVAAAQVATAEKPAARLEAAHLEPPAQPDPDLEVVGKAVRAGSVVPPEAEELMVAQVRAGLAVSPEVEEELMVAQVRAVRMGHWTATQRGMMRSSTVLKTQIHPVLRPH